MVQVSVSRTSRGHELPSVSSGWLHSPLRGSMLIGMISEEITIASAASCSVEITFIGHSSILLT